MDLKLIDTNNIYSLLEEKLNNNWVIILGSNGMSEFEKMVYLPNESNKFEILFVTTNKIELFPVFPIAFGKKTKKLRKFLEKNEKLTDTEFENLIGIEINHIIKIGERTRLEMMIRGSKELSFKETCKKYIKILIDFLEIK